MDTWNKIKAYLKTYFDTLYASLTSLNSHVSNTDNPHSVTAEQVLPDQTGEDGKYLQTDGSVVSWGTVAGMGITRTIITTSGSVTAGASILTDYVYLVAGAHTVTLPTAVGNSNKYTIKNNHTENITVDTTSSQLIDGALTISINPGDSVDLKSSGTEWFIT